MTGYVFAIAVINLGLGYALAVALAHPSGFPGRILLPRLPWLRWLLFRWQKSEEPEGDPLAESDVSVAADGEASLDAPAPPPPAIAPVDELPRSWLDRLESEGINIESFVEGAMQSLNLDLTHYREQLVTAETRLRKYQHSHNKQAFGQLLADLQFTNHDWLDRLTAAARFLADRRTRLGAQQAVGERLEGVLLDQAAQTNDACGSLAAIDDIDDLDIAAREAQHELTRLIDMAHVLRDQINEWVATLLRTQNRLQSLDPKLHQDHVTGLYNRTGLESLFENWWEDDSQRLRLASCAIVDVDRFGKLNERLGTRAGDRLLQAFAQLLSDTIRSERGFDRAGRLTGQSFLVFFGDTGPRNAGIAIERIRQTLEAASFDFQGGTFELTVSCGISEVTKDDTIDTLLRRLQQGVREAKRIGRNRTALDEGDGPKGLEPLHFQIKSRTLSVSDELPVASAWTAV